jgi:hypothetical protein
MKTQAWGWLMMAVAAAGLNASYHDGGMEWAHRLASRVGHSSAAVLALASGHADQFLAEARLVTANEETASCRWPMAMKRIHSQIADRDNAWARIEAESAREQARWARIEANQERIQAKLAAQTAQWRVAASGIGPAAFQSVGIPARCTRIRIDVPQPPEIRVPEIHLKLPGTGPV